MLNPLDVEQQYQNLRMTLSLPGTSFQRLRAVEEFLAGLTGEEPAFESYILDCLDHIPALVKELSRSGHDPEALRRVHDRLRLAAEGVQNGNALAGIREALEEFREIVAGLYAYGAAWGGLSGMLGIPVREQEKPDAHEGTGSRRVELTRMAEQSDDRNVREALERLCRVWDMAVKPQSGMAHVPVVERSLTEEHEGAGSLRRLTVKIFGESGDGRDAIHGDLAVFGVDREETGLTHVPMQAARSVLSNIEVALFEKHFSGQITFGNSHELHEGDSARLAAMTLLVCEILRYENRRIQYRLRPDAALTGSMNAEGSVLDVDGRSLGAKVTAAFFSHVETLVVPRGQAADAEEVLRELQMRYPGRHLDIVGVGHAREVFYDRRAIEQITISKPRHVFMRLWQRRMRVGGIALLLLMGLSLMRVAYGPIDNNPQLTAFHGGMLEIRNKSGGRLGAVALTKMTAQRAVLDPDEAHKLDCLSDVNGDGRNEIVFTLQHGLSDGGMDSVIAVASDCQSVLWTYEVRQRFTFPRRSEGNTGTYSISKVFGGDVDGDGSAEVVIGANHISSFVGIVAVLDGKTGHEKGLYIHTGHTIDLAAADLDGDNIAEILAVGKNNAFQLAFLACLDGRNISGYSVTQGVYTPEGLAPANEKAYLLFPETAVGLAFTSPSHAGNMSGSVVVNAESRQVLVGITDFVGLYDSQGEHVNATLNVIADFDLNIQSVQPGTSYDLVAEHLVRDGRLPHVPDEAYWRGWRSLVRTWKGKH